MSSFFAAMLTVLAFIALAGCGHKTPSAERTMDNETALREWRRNEAVLVKAIEGESQADELLETVIFFHELTGIVVRGDGTTVGYLLDEEAKDDLLRLQRWCEQHCDELYWDRSSRVVKRAPSNDGKEKGEVVHEDG